MGLEFCGEETVEYYGQRIVNYSHESLEDQNAKRGWESRNRASVLEVNRVRKEFWLHLPRNRGYSVYVMRIWMRLNWWILCKIVCKWHFLEMPVVRKTNILSKTKLIIYIETSYYCTLNQLAVVYSTCFNLNSPKKKCSQYSCTLESTWIQLSQTNLCEKF